MKTMTLSHSKKSNPCVSSPTSSSWLRPLSQIRQQLKHGQATRHQLTNFLVRAYKAAHAFLSAQIKSAGINSRVVAAIALLAVLAPACQAVYLLFPAKPIDSTWYHLNWHWYTYIIGPHLFQLTTLTGVFLLFPAHSKRAYFLLIPSGYSIAYIIHISAAQNNEQFHSAIQPHLFIMGMLCSSVIFIMADWFTHRKFHEYDAHMARAKGLIDSNLDLQTKLQHLKTVFEDLRKFHRKY